MRDLLLLAIHLLVTVAKLLRPGGVRTVAAESLLLKQQIIIGSRSRRRAPNLTSLDRLAEPRQRTALARHLPPRRCSILTYGGSIVRDYSKPR